MLCTNISAYIIFGNTNTIKLGLDPRPARGEVGIKMIYRYDVLKL